MSAVSSLCLKGLAQKEKRGTSIRRARSKKPIDSQVPDYRCNNRIRVPEVRLVDHNGQNRGVVSTRDALEIAREANLDLVEVAPNSSPPVARIMDYSKFIYERKRKEREARKHQKKIEIKTVKLKIKTAQFHQDLGIKRAREWLQEGKKVKIEIRFYGREMDYPELGHETMAEVVEILKDVSSVEQQPQFDGRNMIMMLAPGVAEAKKG